MFDFYMKTTKRYHEKFKRHASGCATLLCAQG